MGSKCHLPFEFCQNVEPTVIDRDRKYHDLKLGTFEAYNAMYNTMLNNRMKYADKLDIKKDVIPIGSQIYVKKGIRDSKLNYVYQGPFEVVDANFLTVWYKPLVTKKYQRNIIKRCHVSQVKIITHISKEEYIRNEFKKSNIDKGVVEVKEKPKKILNEEDSNKKGTRDKQKQKKELLQTINNSDINLKKRSRGRFRKSQSVVKRCRGRPRKTQDVVKRRRGRPRKLV